jgi:RHS repeat-associated protein
MFGAHLWLVCGAVYYPFCYVHKHDDLAHLAAAVTTRSSPSRYRYAQGYSFDSDGRLSTVSQTAPTTYTRNYTYHATRKHAVSSLTGSVSWSFGYDSDGNMTSRNVGTAQTLGYDALNRLVSVNTPSAVSYVYDGDDQRVKEAYSTTARYYVGPHMELQVSGTTKIFRSYYRLGDKLLGMRVAGQNAPAAEVGVWYFKIDHLGGVAGSRRASDGSAGLTFYYPYGDTLFTTDTNANSEYRYTGQRRDTVSKIGSTSIGLYFYGSRYFDPYLNRWIQPDTIVPDPYNPMDWDRYQYTRSNPLKYTDPTGHFPDILLDLAFIAADLYFIETEGWTLTNTAAFCADVALAVIPGATGGGAAIQVASKGPQAAVAAYTKAAVYVPELARFGQTGVKFLQSSVNNPEGLGLPESTNGDFPEVIDPRTGELIPAPPDNLKSVPLEQRVEWGNQQRAAFINVVPDKNLGDVI